MTLVLNYKLNSGDIGTEYITGANAASNTNVTSAEDATYGSVADFNGTNSSLLISNIPTLVGNNSRTYCFWVTVHDLNSNITMLSMDTGSDWTWVLGMLTFPYFYSSARGGGLVNTEQGSVTTDTWYHIASTYKSTTSSHELYVNGAFIGSATQTINTGTDSLGVGNINYDGRNHHDGYVLDIRIYDDVLSAAEISTIYQDGPNPSSTTVTPWSTLVHISWGEIPGATSYRIVYDSGVLDVSAATEATVYNLEPLTEYTLQFYVSSDDVTYTLEDTITTVTLSDTPSNANLGIFLNNGLYDFRVLNEVTRSRLEVHLSNAASSGDIILLNSNGLQDTELSLVPIGSTSQTSQFSGDGLMIPFNENSGTSQNITLELSDTSNVVVTYDETTDEISIGGTLYSHGDVFVLDGKKVTVIQI